MQHDLQILLCSKGLRRPRSNPVWNTLLDCKLIIFCLSFFYHCLVRFREFKYLKNRVKTQPLTTLIALLKG